MCQCDVLEYHVVPRILYSANLTVGEFVDYFRYVHALGYNERVDYMCISLPTLQSRYRVLLISAIKINYSNGLLL